MNKKTLILGGVLIVLIALAYIYQGPLKKWQNNLGKPRNIFAGIDTAKIDKIEIASAADTVVLEKLGDKWKYNNSKDFYADPAIMSKVSGSLEAAKISDPEIVSNNRERKSEFKTDSTGLAVKIYQGGKKIADFIIGDRVGDYASTYFSTPESGTTFSVRAGLRDAFEQTEWRDLNIFSADKEKINKIRFQYPNREFTVELKDGKWAGILPEKFTVNQDKIDKIAGIMANLKAMEIPEQTFNNTGLDKHLIIIEATGEAIDNILMFGEKRGDLVYAKRGDSDNIYLINKSERDELDKWIWQLK